MIFVRMSTYSIINNETAILYMFYVALDFFSISYVTRIYNNCPPSSIIILVVYHNCICVTYTQNMYIIFHKHLLFKNKSYY